MTDFPASPDDVTAAWLSDVLGRAISEFEIAYFSEGAGIIGLVTRIHLQSTDDGPPSIIAKFPSPVADNRAVAKIYDMYHREILFYEQIADNLSIRTPACYYSSFDPANQDFVLLIEDLGSYRIGDQVAGCTIEEARAVVDFLAEMHAGSWQPQIENLVSHNNPTQRDGMIGGFQMGWPVVRDQFADLIPPAALAIGEKMPGAIGSLLDKMTADPVCLSHADVRLDNIFFGEDEVIFVDWQSVCTSAPEQDLAYFLTQSVPRKIRLQEDLIERYCSALNERGVGYSLEQCRERYRVCALYLLCYAVVIAGTLDMGNERGQALARTLLGGSLSALEEMDGFSLLD